MNDLMETSKGYAEMWEAGYREGRRSALEEAARLCDKDSTGKVCVDPSHDDRSCPTCDAMNDEADVLGEKIRALKGTL